MYLAGLCVSSEGNSSALRIAMSLPGSNNLLVLTVPTNMPGELASLWVGPGGGQLDPNLLEGTGRLLILSEIDYSLLSLPTADSILSSSLDAW